MLLLKLLLAIAGLAIVVIAIGSFIFELTEALGMFAGFAGAAFVFLVLQNDSFVEFLGLTNGMVDSIAFGCMIGGGIISAMEFEKLGAAMITAGWVAVGLIFMQIIPIPFISQIVHVMTLPFTVACIPLLLVIAFFATL